jgi:hypothetical protein
MRRRKLIAAVALGVLGLVAFGAFVLLWLPRPESASRITRENYTRIHYGMSRAKVEALLGPSGDYRTAPTAKRAELEFATWWMGSQSVRSRNVWIADAAEIRVAYGLVDDAVMATGFVLEPEKNFFVIARWRAERQWRQWFP